MFIEIKFNCSVARSGYEFDEHGMVRPKDPSQGFKKVLLDEIAVFEFTDLFEYLDAEYKTGLPSRTEQVEILRFYNHWGFLMLPEDESESASTLIRSMRDFWFTSGFAPIQVEIKEEKDNLFGQPKLLLHALSLAKVYANDANYTQCQYFQVHQKQRKRRKGTCPPKCRVRRHGDTSWGKGCQRNFIMERTREERSKK